MTQWRDMTTVVDKKSGKLSHGVFTDGNPAEMAENMGPPQQYPASDRDAIKRTTEKTRKRRKKEAAKTQDESSSSLPPAKKARTGDLSSQDATLENLPTRGNTNTDIFSPSDNAEVERHISPGLMKSLVATYEVTSMNIISSSKIQSKVTTIIEKLGSFSFVAALKPNLVLLRAKGAVASKLITIAEITKREIARAGGKWYQYNVLGQVLASREMKSAAMEGTGFTLGQTTKSNVDAVKGHDKEDSQTFEEEEEEETSFETMKTPLERAIEGKPKVQAIPVILIFISRVRSDALKEAYGEQTNALT